MLKDPLQEDKLEDHEPNYDILNIFMDYIPLCIYRNILEIGAGAGVDMNLFINEGYYVTGIGYGDKNIKYAKEVFNIIIHKMDMQNMNFPDNKFDGILSIQVFEHSTCPVLAVKEMYRVLRPGGRALIDVPDARDDHVYGLFHPTILYPEQLIKMFELYGFKLIADLSRKHRTQIIFEKVK